MSAWVNFFFSTPLPYAFVIAVIRTLIDNKRERRISEEFGEDVCEQLLLPRAVGWIGSHRITANINRHGDSFIGYDGHDFPLPVEFLEVEIDAWNITRDEAICLLRYELGELGNR